MRRNSQCRVLLCSGQVRWTKHWNDSYFLGAEWTTVQRWHHSLDKPPRRVTEQCASLLVRHTLSPSPQPNDNQHLDCKSTTRFVSSRSGPYGLQMTAILLRTIHESKLKQSSMMFVLDLDPASMTKTLNSSLDLVNNIYRLSPTERDVSGYTDWVFQSPPERR